MGGKEVCGDAENSLQFLHSLERGELVYQKEARGSQAVDSSFAGGGESTPDVSAYLRGAIQGAEPVGGQ